MWKIPEQFVHIITKLHPEIKGLSISDVAEQSIKRWVTEPTYDTLFLIKLIIYYTEEGPKVSQEEYSKIINDTFHYTYTDMDFVTFDVVKFDVPQPKSNKQKFVELFHVK